MAGPARAEARLRTIALFGRVPKVRSKHFAPLHTACWNEARAEKIGPAVVCTPTFGHGVRSLERRCRLDTRGPARTGQRSASVTESGMGGHVI